MWAHTAASIRWLPQICLLFGGGCGCRCGIQMETNNHNLQKIPRTDRQINQHLHWLHGGAHRGQRAEDRGHEATETASLNRIMQQHQQMTQAECSCK